jgi:hypothetical protein
MIYPRLSSVELAGRNIMAISFLPLLVRVEDKFIRAPGLEETEKAQYPGEKSLTALMDGGYEILTSGLVTLVLFPVLAVVLYRTGYRVAGPLLALFTLGLFLARMFGPPA